MEVDVLEDNRKRVLSEIDRREIEEYIKLHLNKKKKYKLLKIICGLVVCGLIFFSGIFLSKGILGEKVDGLRDGVVTMQTVKKVLYPASDLVSGRYYYKNAVSDEDPVSIGKNVLPGTTNKYVFTYEGTISAGYDLSKINVDVDNAKKIITVKMPKMKIISSEVDHGSFKQIHQNKSIFNNNDVERNNEVMDKLGKAMKKKAKADPKFIKMTEESASSTIKVLLNTSSETKYYEVKVEFTGAENE